MISTDYIKLMAAYTEWQNRSTYQAAGSLTNEERKADRGAFFGSIHATLNHLLWGDQLWLHRLAGTDAPLKNSIPDSTSTHTDWDSLRADRFNTDAAIIAWSERVAEADLGGDLGWFSGAINAEVVRPRWTLVVQLFNHGSHHRGQVHSMLTAAGAAPDDTDVPFMQSDRFPWG